MSPAKRHAKTHAKARHRRHLQAQARLARDYRQAQQAAQALQQALDALGLPEDLVTEIEGRLRSQKSSWAKSLASCFLHSLAVARTPNSAACGAGIKIWCAVKAASRNVNRPQAYRCLVSL